MDHHRHHLQAGELTIKYLILIACFLAFNFTLLFTLPDQEGVLAKGIYPFSDYQTYYYWHWEFAGSHLQTLALWLVVILSILFPKHARKVLGQILILGFLEIPDFVDYMLTHNEFAFMGVDINRLKLFVYIGVIVLTMLDDYKTYISSR